MTAPRGKHIFASVLLLVLVSMVSPAQTAPPTPGHAAQNPAAAASGFGVKVGVIDMQGALAGTNEGQRAFQDLMAKFQPRKAELDKLNAEIEGLKKQLEAQGDSMNPDARAALTRSIETKTKSMQRSTEDAQSDFQQQQNEVAGRILQKLSPVIGKYMRDNGYGLLLDASTPWPQGPVVAATNAVDVTKAIVDAYNVQSGVPAPTPAAGAAKPVAPPGKPQ